ncbi:MAG TPA: hypothetical protein VGL42_05810 [Opitutaceae bacterium]|jgi:hypothetical protein
MQFLTLSRRRPDLGRELDFQRRLDAEANLLRDLSDTGLIQQAWHRGDMPGTCLLLEAKNELEARAALEGSFLVKDGLLEIVEVVPLRPYGRATSPPAAASEGV